MLQHELVPLVSSCVVPNLPLQRGSLRKSQPNFRQVIVLLPLSTKPSLHSNTSVAPMLYLGSDIITVPFLSVRLPGFSHRIAENRQKYTDYDFSLFRSSL